MLPRNPRRLWGSTPPTTPSVGTPVTDFLTLMATAYWTAQIRPTLGDLPGEIVDLLRDQYVHDIRQSQIAVDQLRTWALTQPSWDFE